VHFLRFILLLSIAQGKVFNFMPLSL